MEKEGFTTDFREILPIQIGGDNQSISVPNNIKGNNVENNPYIAFEGDIRIKEENCIEFARGKRKQPDAGKIKYNGWGNCLAIVGASDQNSGSMPRYVKLWDHVEVNNNLKVNERIECQSLNITSDERVKHEKSLLDAKASLEKVRSLKPSQFKYKNSQNSVYGFIAQEIQQVLPTCITSKKSYMANIYDTAIREGSRLTFKHFNTSDLAYKGSTLYSKLQLCSNGEEEYVTIVKIVDEHTLEIESNQTGTNQKSKDGDVLVYGQEVDNFLTIDKNQLFTLTTSGLQAIDHQVQTLEQELLEEREKNKTTLEHILERISTLEAK